MPSYYSVQQYVDYSKKSVQTENAPALTVRCGTATRQRRLYCQDAICSAPCRAQEQVSTWKVGRRNSGVYGAGMNLKAKEDLSGICSVGARMRFAKI